MPQYNIFKHSKARLYIRLHYLCTGDVTAKPSIAADHKTAIKKKSIDNTTDEKYEIQGCRAHI